MQSPIKLYITQIVVDIGHRRVNEDSFRESFLSRSIERKKNAVSYFFVVIVSKSIKNRRVLLKYIFCRVMMLAAVFAFCVLVGAVRSSERPNIILIIADDLVRHLWLFENRQLFIFTAHQQICEVMFHSCVSVCTREEGSHLTIIHDALDLTVQTPARHPHHPSPDMGPEDPCTRPPLQT